MMKRACDFRRIAREALLGRWGMAVGTGFVAALLGATIGSTTGGSSGSSSSNTGGDTNIMVEDFLNTFWHQYGTVILVALILVLVWLVVLLVVSGAARLGYATFNLNLIDRRYASFGDLFSQFHRLGAGFCMNFFMGLYTVLWTMLFIIPGIIKSLSYAMTPYILAEHPEMGANQAITASRRIMDGNKWRLFCLGFSFIGWELLCMLPGIIATAVCSVMAVQSGSYDLLLMALPFQLPAFVGNLFLRPYREAAWAAFYRDISGDREDEASFLPDWSEN